MLVTGKGSVTQMDKSRSPYRCRDWLLQVSTTTGRKTQRFTGSQSDAKLELTRFINILENDQYIKITKFSDYSTYWLNYREQSKEYSPNTIDTDKKYVNKLNLIFADYNLDEMTPQVIRDAFVCIKQTKNPEVEVNGTYKNHMFFTLKAILDMAVDDELIAKNPTNKIKPPKKEFVRRNYLTLSEISNLLNCLDKEPLDGKIIFIYCLVLLGIRKQEAIPLTWNDIDWTRHTIAINKALKTSNNTIGNTKSKSGNRTIPMPIKLEEKLLEWKEVCKKNLLDVDEICVNRNGNRFDGKSNYKWWTNFKDKYKIKNVTFHELRHSNLSVMGSTLNPFELRDYAGWVDLAPAKFYIHTEDDAVINAVRNINF